MGTGDGDVRSIFLFEILMQLYFTLRTGNRLLTTDHLPIEPCSIDVVLVLLIAKFHLGLLWVKGCGVCGNFTLAFRLREGHN